MKELYPISSEIMKRRKTIEGITSYYKSKEISRGALYCDNTAFDYIYEISMRNAVRENLRYFLFIFEIKADGDVRNVWRNYWKRRKSPYKAL